MTPRPRTRAKTHGGDGGSDEEDDDAATSEAAFVYDEWDFQQNDYRPAWCHVRQKPVEPARLAKPQDAWLDEARKVRAVFERLKPDMARREKHLAEGDDINVDLLLDHLVDSKTELNQVEDKAKIRIATANSPHQF